MSSSPTTKGTSPVSSSSTRFAPSMPPVLVAEPVEARWQSATRVKERKRDRQ